MCWYAWYDSTPVLDPYSAPQDDIQTVAGVQTDQFVVQGADGVPLDVCIVTRKSSDELSPRQSRVRDLLKNRNHMMDLEAQPGIVLICTTWDHGMSHSIKFAESLTSIGYTCVLWDPRGQGSARQYCSWGYRESVDVPLILNEVEKRVKHKGAISAIGQGFGASLLLQAAVKDARIRSIVTLDNFCILKSVVMRAREEDLGKPLCYPAFWLTEFGICLRGGYSSYDIVPVDAARSLSIPAMVVCTNESFFSDLKDNLTIYSTVPSEQKVVYQMRQEGEPYGIKEREHVQMIEGRKGEIFEKHFLIHVYDGEDDLMASIAEWIQDNTQRPRPQVLPSDSQASH